MARIRYSGLVTDIAGSIGGSTFQRNYSGATARSRPDQRFLPSTLQGGSRADFSNIASSWSRLSLSVQQLWNTYAAANPITDRWGNVRTLTGFQMYMQSNLNLLSIGVTLLSNPPSWIPPNAVPPFEITAFTNSLHLNFYPAINFPDCDLCVYATAPTTSSKLTNRKNLWLIGHFASPNASIFDITSMYSSTFGLTWASFFNGASCNIIFQLLLVNRITGVASTFQGNILQIRNSPEPVWFNVGSSLSNLGQQSNLAGIASIRGSNSNIVIAGGGTDGRILRSDNAGLTWNSITTFVGQSLVNSIAYCGNGVFLAGLSGSGLIIRSTDYGLTWVSLGQQFSQSAVTSIVYLGNGVCLAGTGTGGLLLRSTDYGLTWVSLGQQFSQSSIFSLLYLESGICLAGTNPGGLILRSTDYGLSWVSLGQLSPSTNIRALIYLGNGICLAAGNGGAVIYRSTDYGQSWSSLGSQFSQSVIYSLLYVGNGVCLAGTGNGGLLLRSTDYGLTWLSLGQQFSQSILLSLDKVLSNILLVGSNPGGLILYSSL